MKLDVEIWKITETERRYLSDDLSLTTRSSPIAWFKEKTPEELNLDEREEDLAMGIFAIGSIRAATIWPSCLDIQVEERGNWDDVEPAVLAVLRTHAGAEEVNTFDSPQNTGEY